MAISRVSMRSAPLPPGTIPLVDGDPAKVGEFSLLARFAAAEPGSAFLGYAQRAGHRVGQVVVKLAIPRPAGGNRARRNYADAAAARVSERFAAPVIARGLHAGVAFLAREYVDGMTLAELCAEDGALDPMTLNAVGVSCAAALAALHDAEESHGNLKPSNVMVTLAGVRLLDHCLGRRSGQPKAQPSADVSDWARLMLLAGGLGGWPGNGGPAGPDVALLGKPLAQLVERSLAGDPERRPTAREILLGLVCPAESGLPGSPGSGSAGGGVAARLRRRVNRG